MFFAATKLFQAKDPHLRRMVYLLIKVDAAAAEAWQQRDVGRWGWGTGLAPTEQWTQAQNGSSRGGN